MPLQERVFGGAFLSHITDGDSMSQCFVRKLDPEMGLAVAKRTYLREGETWGDLAVRVALGNSLLHSSGEDDRLGIQKCISKATFLTAGRHLQHGDITQPSRNLEIFSNCSTACTSFLKFLLLLNGSGVGRNYSNDVMVLDWRKMPHIYCVLSRTHPDYVPEYHADNGDVVKIIAREDLNAYYQDYDVWHEVADNREGWAKGLETLEVAAFQGRESDHFVLDFSELRKKGSPIHGMQGRPASGPLPLMYAFIKAAQVKYQEDMAIWKQNMIVDHFFSEAVVNGGARRSSRICVKFWKDEDIFEFIRIKKDNPWLWSSNNSVGVDREFWEQARTPGTWGFEVFNAITEAQYLDGTGEPGIINVDLLTVK